MSAGFEKFILKEKWHDHTRYGCPKCAFTAVSTTIFEDHIKTHRPRVIPVCDMLSLNITDTEAR